MATTNDFVIVQPSSPSYLSAGLGDDTYLISKDIMTVPGQTVNIIDAAGTNSIQLVGGLSITKAVATATILVLTLSNGDIINLEGANSFSFAVGANAVAGIAGTVQTYSQLLTTTLGFAAVPTTEVAVTVQPATPIVIGGGTSPGQAYTLTTGNDTINSTTGNDTITGGVGTFQAADVINDPSMTDADTLTVSMNSYVATAATILNIETINAKGLYASAGLDAASTIGTKTLNLSSDLAGATGTLANGTASKVAKVVAGTNITNLIVNNGAALAAGTAGTVTVDGGAATTIAVGNAASAGSDTYNITVPVLATTTLLGGNGGTDAFTLNVPGGATNLTITNQAGAAATGDINTLLINSNTAANTITLTGAKNNLTGTASGDGVTVGGTQNLTIRGDLEAFALAGAASTRTSNVALTKAAGAGTVTLVNTAAFTAHSWLNRAQVDFLTIGAAAGAFNLVVNENTQINLNVANNSALYGVDNATTTAITAGSGTLMLNLTGTSTANATQALIATDASTGTVIIANNTIDSTITALQTTNGAVSETVVVNGSKNLTIPTFTGNVAVADLLTAAGMTGNLTATIGANAATVVGGSGNDTITGGAAADNVRGSAGNDVLNGGAGNIIDTMVGGTGNDQFVLQGTTSAAGIDIISDFSTSGTNGIDVAAFSFAGLGTAGQLLDSASNVSDVTVAAGTTAKTGLVSGATVFAAGSTENILVVTGTFTSSAALQTALEVGGTRQVTTAAALDAKDQLIVVWTDGTNGHIGSVETTAGGTTFAAADLAYVEAVTLSGITDVSAFASANFLFIA